MLGVGIHEGVPMVRYMKDDVGEKPALSSSTAQALLTESPLAAWAKHPKLGGLPSTPTASTERGDLIHSLVLGAGKELVAVEADDWRTKVAKEARELARAAGKVPVLAGKLEDAQVSAQILTRKLEDQGIVFDGKSEVTLAWVQMGVLCKGRLDHYKGDHSDLVGAGGVMRSECQVIDLKTTFSAHPDNIRKSIEEYGYHVQRAAYLSGLQALRPELTGKIDYVLAFVETEAPFDVTVTRLAPTLALLGMRRWQRAIAKWDRCLTTNKWPGAAGGVHIETDASPWAISKDMEEQLAPGGSEAIPF